jgi:L-seryl-tRNA(Ser) seleniumtransferase
VSVSSKANSQLFRLLPSVDELLRQEELQATLAAYGRTATIEAVHAVLEDLRAEIGTNALDEDRLNASLGELPSRIHHSVEAAFAPSLRAVINATGVILHTNLGRAPLSRAAMEHVAEVSESYSNLEFDLKTGERGKRDVHVDRLFSRLLNTAQRAVSTIVVNNNAAAVLLALNTLAQGGEVIVSRGELVEIGGSFRIPDVMAKSGAILREVGTTNRTRIADYEQAINERTRLLLRVHRSNFQIVGCTEQPSLEELVSLGHCHQLPVMEDLGSGALFDLRQLGIRGEPAIAQSVRAGIDLITYSGDKLLGAPQAGMISGDSELVRKVRSNAMFRALRVDKMIYAALEATLLAYLREDYDAVPALRMMRIPAEQIAHRAERLAEALRLALPQTRIEVLEARSVLGGGSAPGSTLPTRVVAIAEDSIPSEELLRRLRDCAPPVIARVEDNRVLFDLRTVAPEHDLAIAAAIKGILR